MPEEQRFVLGIAYQAGPDPRIKRGMDGGRDWFSKAELERACWSYMRSGCPQINAFHVDGTEDCAEPVESFIWRWDDWDVGDGVVVKDGDWCLGAILSPHMWNLHKSGHVNAFSPEGTATRRRVRKEGAMAFAKGSADIDDYDTDDDEFTELVNADVPKIALVGQGANGIPRFLMSKQEGAAGLFDPDAVRALLEKSETTAEASHAGELVTMSGSPAAIAALIHGAPVRKAEPGGYDALCKAKYNAAELKHMAATGAAMDNESYPIGDAEDLHRAIRAVGRGGSSHDAIRRHIATRAKSLGLTSELPDNWNTDGSLKKAAEPTEPQDAEVTKDMDTMDPEALDPTVLLAEPENDDAPGNPSEPGSPAWESIDAATARKWTAILARARAALELMSDRENLEAASADPDDAEAACDLQDAACAIDYAISILAPFAVDEQAEADCCGDEMGIIGKALGAFDVAPLETVEALAQVRKAGRVLSSANEDAIRGAVESLQKVLASLPAAPTADTDGGQAVAKTANEEPDMDTPTLSADVTEVSGQEPAMGIQSPQPQPVAGAAVTDVSKADGDKPAMMAVYDADGNLIGIVDPGKVTEIQGAKAAAPDAGHEDEPEQDAPETPAAPPTDLTPAPSVDAGTPADEVTKTSAEAPAGNENVLKGSDIATLVKAAIDEYSAGQADFVKGLKDQNAALEERNQELIKTTASLAERLTAVENAPAVMAIAGHGAVPPRELLRGQDQGGSAVELTKGQELRKQLAMATDAVTQERIKREMNELAVAQLGAIHQHPSAV